MKRSDRSVNLLLGLAGFLILVAAAPAVEPLPEKVVVLTFDDSVKSHYTIVRPVLKELGFSATFFVTEGFDFLTNKRDYMSWKQIRQLHLDGFEIGNHTRDHLAVTAETLSELEEQIRAIDEKCEKHGIPKPVSFAYPENLYVFTALPVLEEAGFRFARRGGSPERDYGEGEGVAYQPGQDHPLLIPSAGDARPHWTLEDFKAALDRASEGEIPVLQFHGVPDRAHPWVSTSPKRFREFMAYLKQEGYRVLALKDLESYVDPSKKPEPSRVLLKRLTRKAGSGSR